MIIFKFYCWVWCNQNGDLVILDKPGYIEYQGTGTSHGTTYSYDTCSYFFTDGILKKGSHLIKKRSLKYSTISQKLNFQISKANVLEEVLDDK
jgi:hypothetical protein